MGPGGELAGGAPVYAVVLSIVIPAWNEERWIGATVRAASGSARALGLEHEVIVVDDASDDRTAGVAGGAGARVVASGCRQIAGTRNAGAREARGELILFVDADTAVNPAALGEALALVRAGAVAASAPVRFDGWVPPYARLLLRVMNRWYRAAGLMTGSFMLCRAEAVRAIGGLDETIYAGEEADFALRLRRHGRVRMAGTAVVTSGRKVRAYGAWVLLGAVARVALAGPRGVRSRDRLGIWYADARRDPGGADDLWGHGAR